MPDRCAQLDRRGGRQRFVTLPAIVEAYRLPVLNDHAGTVCCP